MVPGTGVPTFCAVHAPLPRLTPVTTPLPLRSLVPGQGEVIDVLGDILRVLADSSTTSGACAIFISEVPPGGGPPLHRHSREDEHFYVLEGTALFQVDGERLTLGPGGYTCAQRGTVHAFSNPGTTPLRMVITCTPGGIEVPFRKADQLLRTARAAGATIPPLTEAIMAQMQALFADAGVQLLGPPLAHA